MNSTATRIVPADGAAHCGSGNPAVVPSGPGGLHAAHMSVPPASPEPPAAPLPAAGSGASTSPEARANNVAIWARVTGRSPQKRNGSAAQPAVIPAAASASILASCPLDSMSVNPAAPAASMLNARTKNVAIWARVTGRSPQ